MYLALSSAEDDSEKTTVRVSPAAAAPRVKSVGYTSTSLPRGAGKLVYNSLDKGMAVPGESFPLWTQQLDEARYQHHEGPSQHVQSTVHLRGGKER